MASVSRYVSDDTVDRWGIFFRACTPDRVRAIVDTLLDQAAVGDTKSMQLFFQYYQGIPQLVDTPEGMHAKTVLARDTKDFLESLAKQPSVLNEMKEIVNREEKKNADAKNGDLQEVP